MTVIIVEGVVATGKTTLLRALQKTELWQERPTKLVVSEHYTERVLELTQPEVADRVRLLDKHVEGFRTLHDLWRDYRFKGQAELAPLAIFERFHLTHAAHVGDFSPFRRCEEGLRRNEALLVVLYHPLGLMLPRIMATEHSRNPMWQRWLRSLGSEKEIEDYFTRLQDRTLAYYEESGLPKVKLEAWALAPVQMAEEIVKVCI